MKTCLLSVHNSIQVLAARRFLPAIALVLLACLALLPGRAAAAVFDDFESYAVGSNLQGQGGWAGFAGDLKAGALVSSAFSFSRTRSVNITGASDLARTFSGATNGQWVFSVMQYIPSTSTGTTYVILLNTYRSPYRAADLNWSVQIQNNMATGQIISDLGGGATLPMVKDAWVEVRCEINLDANSVSEFYNGQLLSTHAWQDGTGLNEIQALDLYAKSAGPVYYDNVSLAPIQSYTVNVRLGLNLIANQLDHGGNTLNEVFPNVPDGCVFYKYNNSSSTWAGSSYNAATGRWVPGSLTLNPGEGAFLQSPSNFSLTFTGTPHVPVLPISIPNGQSYLLSRQTTDIGTYDNIVGTVPPNLTRVYKWNGFDYTIYTKMLSGWTPSAPSAAVGEAMWIGTEGSAPAPIAAAPLIEAWPKTQLVPVGSDATFSVKVAGLSPISFQWFKNSDPIASATGAVFTISSVTLSNTAYYYLVASNAFGITTSPTALLRAYKQGPINPDDPPSVAWDFGDLPAPSWTCWQSSSFDENCNVQTIQYTTESIPPVIYPTTLAQSGATHSWSSATDLTWLGTDVTPTSDGIPHANAKGDPRNDSGGNGADFTAAGILQEENGIRMIPNPFSTNVNQIDQSAYNARGQTFMVDPRFTSQGLKGGNLFGSASSLYLPLSEGQGQLQHRQCYKPGEIVWFTVEAHNNDEYAVTSGNPSTYENGVSYLNVWIDYGDGNDPIVNPADGVFQPNEYVVVDQPLWGCDMLAYFLPGWCDYPYNTGGDDFYGVPVLAGVEADYQSYYQAIFNLPNIGVQPYAAEGLQVVSFQIPASMNVPSCGKKAFARFRISKKPLNLFHIYTYTDNSDHVHDACSWPAPTGTGYNTYGLLNTAGVPQPDPSLNEVTGGGEVEDYPLYFVANCNASSIFGTSYLCMSPLNKMASISASTLASLQLDSSPTTLAAPADGTQMSIKVANGNGWPVAQLGDPATWFYIQVADGNSPFHTELMLVKVSSGGPNVNWAVVRGQQCTEAAALGSDSIVTLASRCQCELDQGAILPSGMLNVSGSNPGIPCDYSGYPHFPFDPVYPEQHPFVVQVGNSGSFDLSGVTVSYAVPSNAVFQSASVSQGTWSNRSGTVSFNLGLLQVGQTAQIGISFQPKFSGLINHQFDLAADQPLLGPSTYQVLNYVRINPVLNIESSSSHTATITWPTNDAWTLQQSSSVVGGWTNAPSQTNPYTVPANQAMKFFRLRNP